MMTESKELRVSGRTDLGGKLWKIGKTTFFQNQTRMIIAETQKRSAKDFIAVVPRRKKKEKKKKDIAITIQNRAFRKKLFFLRIKSNFKKI